MELILPWLMCSISCVCVIVRAELAHRQAPVRCKRETLADTEPPAAVQNALRLTLWAALAGLAVAVVWVIAWGIVGIGPTGLFQWSRSAFTSLRPLSGSLLVFAPLVGVAVFAGVVAFRPAVQWSVAGNVREADILVEQPRALLRQLSGFAAAAVALLILTALVGAAVQSGDQGSSPMLTVTRGGATNEIGYPGAGYVLAVVVTVLAVAGFVVAAGMRVRSAPGPGIPGLVALDRAVRSWQTELIALAGSAAMTLSIGITSWAIGHSYATIARFPVIGDCHSTGPGSSICREIGAQYAQPAFAIGVSEVIFGAILVAVSFILVVVIARRIRDGIRVRLLSSTDPVRV